MTKKIIIYKDKQTKEIAYYRPLTENITQENLDKYNADPDYSNSVEFYEYEEGSVEEFFIKKYENTVLEKIKVRTNFLEELKQLSNTIEQENREEQGKILQKDLNFVSSETIAYNIHFRACDIFQELVGNDTITDRHSVCLADIESRELSYYFGSDNRKINLTTKLGKVKLKEILNYLIEEPLDGIPVKYRIAYMAVMYLAFGSYIPEYFKGYKEAKVWVKKGFVEYREDVGRYVFNCCGKAKK